MNPQQADAHLVEMVGKQLVGKPAEFAGDEAMHSEERVFGWIQAETETDEYKARNDAFEEELASEYDGEIATRFTYLFDPSQGRRHRHHGHRSDEGSGRDARSSSAPTRSSRPTSPRRPPPRTTSRSGSSDRAWPPTPPSSAARSTRSSGATPSASGSPSARAERELGDSYLVYEWYYGKPPATNIQAALGGVARLAWPSASTSPVRTSRRRASSAACSARHGTNRGSPTPATPGATACGPTPTATPATTPPPSGGTPTPPVRTRPATRASARSCTSTAGSGPARRVAHRPDPVVRPRGGGRRLRRAT